MKLNIHSKVCVFSIQEGYKAKIEYNIIFASSGMKIFKMFNKYMLILLHFRKLQVTL